MSIEEKAKDLFAATVEQVPDVVSSIVLEGVVGTVVPGVSGAMLAYRQKRQERIYTAFLEEIKSKMVLMEERLNRLSADALIDFKDKYFGMVSDYVLEEVQERKVKYLANGLVNLSGMEQVNEDFVLTYYDTLRDLRIRDILVLNRYRDLALPIRVEESYPDFLYRLNIDEGQYGAILEKLERIGLLETKRAQKEDDLYSNLMAMQEYLEKQSKGKSTSLKKLKKLDRRDAYRISRYGREFIQFFEEVEDKS